MNNFRGLILLLALPLSLCLYGKPIKVIGTYDLNKNNLNEVLILKDGGIQYVEIDDNGNHQELWYYHPNGVRSAFIVDVVLANINEDPNPEIIAIISSPSIISDKKTPWLVAFKWTGRRFSSVPMEDFLIFLMRKTFCVLLILMFIKLIAYLCLQFRLAVLLEKQQFLI